MTTTFPPAGLPYYLPDILPLLLFTIPHGGGGGGFYYAGRRTTPLPASITASPYPVTLWVPDYPLVLPAHYLPCPTPPHGCMPQQPHPSCPTALIVAFPGLTPDSCLLYLGVLRPHLPMLVPVRFCLPSGDLFFWVPNLLPTFYRFPVYL